MLSMIRHIDATAQGGTPMTVTGETLPRSVGAGRLAAHFVCLKISSGGPGGDAPPVRVPQGQP